VTTLDKDLKYDEVKAVNNATINVDTAKGIVEAFAAAIGNKDSVGDIIVPGAFAKSLQRRKPRVVWGHDWNSPIGKVLEIEEIPPTDPRIPLKMKQMNVGGLYVKVQFNLGSARGKEAFNDVLFYGTEQEWSIGYKTLRKNYDPDRQANVLHEVDLYEVSPVLHGANNLTSTISIKDNAVDSTSIKDNTFYIDSANTSSTWTGSGSMGGTSWDFQMDEKAFGEVVPPELQRTQGAVPTMEDKLRKAFTSAFGEISDLKLMDDGQAVFQRGDSTWAVKYRIDGPKLMVTRPEKVTVRTVVSPVAPVETEEHSHHDNDMAMARKDDGCGDDCNCGHGSKSRQEVTINVSADIDTESFEAVRDQVKSYFEAEEKAGRVISTGNMSKLSKAAGMLNEVIQSGTMMTDERPPMQKKDGSETLLEYKTSEAVMSGVNDDTWVEMAFGSSDSGKSLWLTPDGENPTLDKVVGLLEGLEPLAVKHGWTLLAPTQKHLDEGSCSLGIRFSTDDNMIEQVKGLDALLKEAECNVKLQSQITKPVSLTE
jgi:HK97 family phage prohead protease